MGARGPAKGKGGRPRTKHPATRSDGYKRVTTGPAGKGTQVLQHRAVAGVGKGSLSGKEGVVAHKNKKRGDNSKKNLKKTSKAKNNTKRGY